MEASIECQSPSWVKLRNQRRRLACLHLGKSRSFQILFGNPSTGHPSSGVRQTPVCVSAVKSVSWKHARRNGSAVISKRRANDLLTRRTALIVSGGQIRNIRRPRTQPHISAPWRCAFHTPPCDGRLPGKFVRVRAEGLTKAGRKHHRRGRERVYGPSRRACPRV